MSTVVNTPHGCLRITDHAIDQAQMRLGCATPAEALATLKHALHLPCLGISPQAGNAMLIETRAAGLMIVRPAPGYLFYLVTVLAPNRSGKAQHQPRGGNASRESIPA